MGSDYIGNFLIPSAKAPVVNYLLCIPFDAAFQPGRLSENSARSEDCEKLRIKISASEENSGAI